MSQLSIYTSLVFQGAEAIAEAKRVEAEFRGVAQRISGTPINVEIRFDDASVSAIAKLRAEADQPIRIPIEAVDRVTPMLSALRAEQAAIPILIPLGLDPASVAQVTTQIQALASLAATAATAGATTAGAAPAITGPAVATAAALTAQPTQAIAPPAGAPVTAAAAPAVTQAMTMAEAAAETAAVVGASTPYATVPYSGVQAAPEAANAVALRSVFRALLVAKVAADTGAAGARATALGAEDLYHVATGEGYSTTRLQERQGQVKAAQEDIKSIPLLGSFIESIGEHINRGASAYFNTVNYATGKRGGGLQMYESDAGYAERLTTATAEQDRHTKELEREVTIREHIAQQIDQATQRTRDQAALERATGLQRIQLSRDARMAELNAELQDPRYRDARGQLTGQGRIYQQARTGLIDAQYSREFEANAVQGSQFARTLDAARLREQGRTREAENVDFESQLTAIRQRYKDQGRAQEFDAQLEPTLRRTFNRDQGIAIHRQAEESAAAVRGSQETGTEADLRTQGREREAGLNARAFAIDERVRKLHEAAEAETDLTRKTQLRAEAQAAADAGMKEKTADAVEFRKQQAASVASFEMERMRAETDTTRDSLDTQLRLFDEYWARRVNQAQAGAERHAAVGARDAARTALIRRHELETQDIGESAHELELRNQGRNREAERARIRYEANKEAERAGDDQKQVAAIRRRERAELRGVDREGVAVFSGESEYARNVLEESAQQEGSPSEPERQAGETLDAFRKRQSRAKFGREATYRPNPLTAKWDERAERGHRMRLERGAEGAYATDLGAMVMPGGPLDFGDRAKQLAKAGDDESGPFDKQTAKDLKDGANLLYRAMSDPNNRLYVVR
jgi:hypothetical protein